MIITKLTQWIKNKIAINLPRKGKRIICLTLSYLLWSRCSDEDVKRCELIELNNKLRLSNSIDSLNFVIELNKILEKDEEIKSLYQLAHEEIKQRLVTKLPNWLKYDDEDNMKEELNLVFNDRYLHLS